MAVNRELRPIRNLFYAFVLFGACAAVILIAPVHQSPALHTAFDGGIFVLTGVLALLMSDMAWRVRDELTGLLAVVLAITAAFELLHVIAAVEFSSNPLTAQLIATRLRPSTWPPATYLLPLGLIAAYALRDRTVRANIVLAVGLAMGGIGLGWFFDSTPSYSAPNVFGMTRPSLAFVPLAWLLVFALYWRQRAHERVARYIALFCILAVISNIAMLYSRFPADDPALLAHAGKFANRLFLLFTLMQFGTFDTMRRALAERELNRVNDALEERVRHRTADLEVANAALRAEAGTRGQAENKALAQLHRLRLLQMITHAIAERQDLASIFQVVVRRLEDHLKVDFALLCHYDAVERCLNVASVGPRSLRLANELDLGQGARIEAIENGLGECVHGALVYEPDVASRDFQFPRRLLSRGLMSMVAVPLLVEQRSGVFGVLIVARRQINAFSSGDCEFFHQLGENVALASNQAQLNAALQRAYDELRDTQQAILQQERLRALGQMASGIAHDINNAISPATLYLDSILAHDARLEPKTRTKLETVRRAIGDVAQTVSRMGEFYRQREPQLKTAPVNINVIMSQIPDLTRARWSDIAVSRGASIQVKVEEAPGAPSIMAIESEIREALINLVFNAADAMPRGGVITLRARGAICGAQREQFTIVEVCDNGIGMDEKTRSRCLEPFFTTKGDRGTGLGLAMVYGIAQRHCATLEIDSEPDKGTTVRFRFPTAEFAEAEVSTAGETVKRALRILLVDDDSVILQSLRDALEYEGHEVVCAHGGQSGIDMFNAACDGDASFAAVVTDLGMPQVDGRQVAAAVKVKARNTLVIMLTGWGQQLDDRGSQSHVDAILAKPPNMWELRDALARASLEPVMEALNPAA